MLRLRRCANVIGTIILLARTRALMTCTRIIVLSATPSIDNLCATTRVCIRRPWFEAIRQGRLYLSHLLSGLCQLVFPS